MCGLVSKKCLHEHGRLARMSGRRALRLFADQEPLQPQSDERTPTTGHGAEAVRREQYLLAHVLDRLERAWPGGPAMSARAKWID